ncbi:hypothetical protein [Reichenbachiella sp. MSK19-1]|uniref:hypothetical protein n=1 Tax=Reichenbachiella sp. MSK19-1 TaxID=1897631 RepID=UPI000E6C2AAB|nr:hypothetical protein [Reichenbachiella sp. MSK19-1]RJE74954.1 hypothetical protein BGP76_17700 [Reichenbachiella sp. MSK19-1]
MSRTLNPEIISFDIFYHKLVDFVSSGQSCFSVRDKKEYTSWMDGKTICMSGVDRKSPSVYDTSTLINVFETVKNGDDIKTEMLDKAVGRERSPILALMIASKVLNQS